MKNEELIWKGEPYGQEATGVALESLAYLITTHGFDEVILRYDDRGIALYKIHKKESDL